MIKIQRILAGSTLLVVFGFMMIVWAGNRPALQRTHALQLRFTFASGDSANVTQTEGSAITVEKDGKKLTITPYMRDRGQVELRNRQRPVRYCGGDLRRDNGHRSVG